MEKKAENERAIALCVPGHPALSDAKRLIYAALGGRRWGALEIEIIAGRESVPPEAEKWIYDLLCENGMESRLQNLYKGLDTPVTKTISPAGVDFSGGETQKIAIARAIYKGAPVLILDEPTSALDPVAEYEVYQRFSEMSEGRLTIYISHRISSTRFCDRIAVFDKGEIKEYGTFDELMEQKGLYYDFFRKQAEYFR